MKLDKTNSQMIKGIAIVLMVFHHLFTNPTWILDNIHYFTIKLGDTTLEQYIAAYGKICISIYAFISGYGLYLSYIKQKPGIKSVAGRFAKILLNWWLVVFLIFLPLSVYTTKEFSLKVLLDNLLLINGTWCPFADYLLFYFVLILIYPLLFNIIQRLNSPICVIILSPIVSVIARKIVGALGLEGFGYDLVYFTLLYLPYVLTGACVAQGEIYQKLSRFVPRNKKWVNFIVVSVLLCTVLCRWFIFGNRLIFDSFIALVFVFCCIVLLQYREQSRCGKILLFLGKHSTNIWFIHAVFFFSFAQYTQKIVFMPYIPILITAWCVVLCLPSSALMNKIIKLVDGIKGVTSKHDVG